MHRLGWRRRGVVVAHGGCYDREENIFLSPARFLGGNNQALDGRLESEETSCKVARMRSRVRRGRVYGWFQFPAPSIESTKQERAVILTGFPCLSRLLQSVAAAAGGFVGTEDSVLSAGLGLSARLE